MAQVIVDPIPRISLNGTSREELIEQRKAICDALLATIEALDAAAPHGRDYQTAPRGSYELARAQHAARRSMLDNMRKDITDEALAILAQ